MEAAGHICKVCRNTDGNRTFTAHEMMFGIRDSFTYVECSSCGCLQILDSPDDLSPYYPDDYYSFEDVNGSFRGLLRKFIDPYRARDALVGDTLIGSVLGKVLGPPEPMQWFRRANVGFDDAVLDVGCGAGQLLRQLGRMGFTDLTGIDAYIEQDLFLENGVTIYKKELSDVDGSYDFIMLHHVFEHLPDPVSAFRNLHRLIRPNRFVLIRIPVASSFAWRKYGPNWVQLDAPRHFFLHTYESMDRLSSQAGFRIVDVINDSTALQFWGSEQYEQGIPLMDERSYLKNKDNGLFTPDQIAVFERRASELNESKDGDSSCFYLVKE